MLPFMFKIGRFELTRVSNFSLKTYAIALLEHDCTRYPSSYSLNDFFTAIVILFFYIILNPRFCVKRLISWNFFLPALLNND